MTLHYKSLLCSSMLLALTACGGGGGGGSNGDTPKPTPLEEISVTIN